jgi:predicted transcriptional regulator
MRRQSRGSQGKSEAVGIVWHFDFLCDLAFEQMLMPHHWYTDCNINTSCGTFILNQLIGIIQIDVRNEVIGKWSSLGYRSRRLHNG